MATLFSKRERPWYWAAFVLGTMWVSIGCTPASLSMFFMPFVDDKIAPICKLADKKIEKTICVVASFASQEVRSELMPSDGELADLVTVQLRKRTLENKEKIKVLPPSKVRSLQNLSGEMPSPAGIAKECKADYVISIEIQTMSLYEKSSYQQLYRGNIDMMVRVLDASKPADEGVIFTEAYRCEYPGARGPMDAGEMSIMAFRTRFLNKVASEVARYFTAYPREERLNMD